LKKVLWSPCYVFFFVAYPTLELLSHNITQAKYTVAVRSLVLSWLAVGFLFLIFLLIYRNPHRAAFIATTWSLLFFAYGQVYDTIWSTKKLPHFTSWMLASWLLLAVLMLVLAALPKLHFETLALGLNVVSLGLVIYVLVPVVNWSAYKTALPARTQATAHPKQVLDVAVGQMLPDIYYIMPEDYGRADLLQQQDQIDTSQFLHFLNNEGFYIASCSQSNYVTSELSLGSSLNMDYLQNLGPGFSATNEDQNPIWNAIRYNVVEADLKQVGYKTVAFATGFAWSELDNSDVYITPAPYWSGMNGFESMLLRTTPIRHLEDVGVLNLDDLDGENYRQRTLLDFKSVAGLVSMPGPKFVFMHIINPHPPFVFAADGSKTDPGLFLNQDRLYTQQMYIQGFQNQVPFINQMLEQAVSTLISKSTRPLVIVLQTDTGPWFTNGADQFKILNALYLPGHTDQLYQSISPVNTFRVILNAYFGTQLPLLEDLSYFSPIPYIYKFSPVANPCAVN
jgi:hypothetical protein